MGKILNVVLIAAVLSVACYGQETSSKVDCYSFLQGTQKPVDKDYSPAKMSEFALQRATETRVCIMTFVQLDALRPLLQQDPESAAKLSDIERLYRSKRQAIKGSEQYKLIDNKLDEAIHELFQHVAAQSPERLATLADKLRNDPEQVRSEGYNPLQAELMARYLEIKALQRERRSGEIPAVVDELRSHTAAGSLKDDGLIDDADENTFFRAQTLWSAITAYDLSARAVRGAGKPEVLSIVATYLDIPQSSLGLTFAPGLGDFIPPLTRTMKILAASSSNNVRSLNVSRASKIRRRT